ncbi:MAG TPA: LiaF domain-containing protein [Elusimicrobiota bacterium]|jgi:Cell wall-active antibiotics response LiaF, C-terminal|nr:LiaF domain-containing protein [Elusimicrobiota bacterium]
MKMNWFAVIAGTFLVLLGFGMILQVFGIHLPLVRTALALLIIYAGVRVLLPGSRGVCRGWTRNGAGSAVFSSSSVEHSGSEPAEYNVAFGSQKIDLTKVDLSKGDVRVRVNAAFGSTEVKLDPATPVKIVFSCAFGGVKFPGGSAAVIGTNTYKSESYKEGLPALLIDADAAFGEIKITN